ncbi:TetR/AcrR family transcriptional regulator [Paenibacillus harenae]|uniref:TetR/AcrR family transcriptional regulator n=1 Tax=Paenibacillus harenae TaxID=306543 RepID=UPI0003F6A1B9|nr:TetR/AcrR family transcriptional regulator [Paenibacillus harenae]
MVQVLKEELRTAILYAAQDEFIKHGFLSASVKRIAGKVGISVGNLYRYYAGKDALFEAIVGPAYIELERILIDHDKGSKEDASIPELIVETLYNITTEFRRSLLILLYSSTGTRHEETVQKIYRMMAENIVKHLVNYNRKLGKEIYTEQVSWPISVAFMQGFFEIIRQHPDTHDYKKMLHQYITFWYQGLQAII